MRWACVLLTCLVVQSCAGKYTATNSQYFRPERGKLYDYGNFCGPGVPALPSGISVLERIQRISDTDPVDDIDRVCQYHDLCFERFGADNFHCDRLFADYLSASGHYFGSSQCQSMTMELVYAFINAKPMDAGTASRADIAAWSIYRGYSFSVPVIMAGVKLTVGYPSEPGTCVATRREAISDRYGRGPAMSDYLRTSLRSAAAAAACRTAGGFEERDICREQRRGDYEWLEIEHLFLSAEERARLGGPASTTKQRAAEGDLFRGG